MVFCQRILHQVILPWYQILIHFFINLYYLTVSFRTHCLVTQIIFSALLSEQNTVNV